MSTEALHSGKKCVVFLRARSQTTSAAIACSVALSLLGGLGTTTAQAGEYIVSPCEQGRPDPATPLLSAYVGAVIDRCKALGSYGMDFGGHTLHRTFKGFDLTVPASAPNTSILGMSASIVMAQKSGANGSSGGIYYGDPTTTQMWPMSSPQGWTMWADYNDPQRGPLDVVVDVGTNVRQHRMMANCNEPCSFGALPDGSDVSVSKLRVRLYEAVAPKVTAFEASGLLGSGSKSGTQVLTFTAHDDDSGVQGATLSPSTGATVSAAGCGRSAAAACPNDQTLRATIDTSKLDPGAQTLTVTLHDAAGNATDVKTPTFTVASRATPVVPTPTPTPAPTGTGTGLLNGSGEPGGARGDGDDAGSGAPGQATSTPNGATPGTVTFAPHPKHKAKKRLCPGIPAARDPARTGAA